MFILDQHLVWPTNPERRPYQIYEDESQEYPWFFLGALEVIVARQTLVPLPVIARVGLRLLDQAQSWAVAQQLQPPRPAAPELDPTWLSEGNLSSWLYKTDITT